MGVMDNKLKLYNSVDGIYFGLLYNWYAATDASLIYADGWKIPTSTEFNTLRQYSDPDNYATIFKEPGTTYWLSPNTWATNTAKFNGRGAGFRDGASTDFTTIKERLIMLTSADSGANTTTYAMQEDTSVFSFSAFPKNSGASIRLLKVSTSLSDGEAGSYTGNDGKVYRTICIGTQEWLADNLSETKYRDGTPIPEVAGSSWTDLTTGALCAYDNNWAYVSGYTNLNAQNKLKLTGGSIISVLNFDGSTQVHVDFYDTSLFGRLDLEFNLWLDATNNYNAAVLSIEPSTSADSSWSVYLQDSSIYIEQNYGHKHYSIVNLNNQILRCVIRKDETARQGPEFFKINTVEQTGVGGEPVGITGYFNQTNIGLGLFRTGTSDKLVNGTVWDIKITEVSTGNLIRYWKGYPNPTSNNAWVDNVGNIDLTVSTVGAALTERIIYGMGSESGGANKLLLHQSNESGLLDFTEAYASSSNDPDISVNKTVTFYLYLDTDTHYSNESLINFHNTTDASDGLKIVLTSSEIVAHTGSAVNSAKYSIAGRTGEILYCELVKGYKSITSFKINGEAQSSTGSAPAGTGYIDDISGFGYGGSYFSDGALWNIQLLNSSVVTNSWKGYPNGDTNSAWVDLVGDVNCTVGGPDPKIRNTPQL